VLYKHINIAVLQAAEDRNFFDGKCEKSLHRSTIRRPKEGLGRFAGRCGIINVPWSRDMS
jgi:hypothetical protein